MTPGVRLDLRDLPDRRRDAALPASSRAARRSRSRWSRRTRRSRACGTTPTAEEPTYSDTVELDLGDRRAVARRARSARRTASRCRRAERVPRGARGLRARARRSQRRGRVEESFPASDPPARRRPGHDAPQHERRTAASTPVAAEHAARRCRSRWPTARETELDHGHVVIAAITSCTNTSNPSVMLGAGLARAQRRRARPDAQAVGQDARWRRARRSSPSTSTRAGLTDDLERARLQPRRLRLHDVHRQLGAAARGDLRGRQRGTTSRSCSVLSGNRNFEGRINPDVRMNYLASPPLRRRVRARRDDGHRPRQRPARPGRRRRPRLPARHLAVASTRSPRRSEAPCSRTCSARATAEVFDGDERLEQRSTCRPATASRGTTTRPTCASRRTSRACPPSPSAVADIHGARVLAMLGDSRHDRPHLAGRARSRRTAPRAATCRSTASSSATSTPTARGAATTR